MGKPSVLPVWDENNINSTEPDATRKANGWIEVGGVPEKPPFQYFNFWQRNVYKWIEYFSDLGIERRLDSVAAMKVDVDLEVGDYVLTAAYYSTQEGGSGVYEIVAAGTGVDDGFIYHDLSGSGFQAKLVNFDVVNIRQAGAKGDGVTNDTASINAAALIKGQIFAPEGEYLHTGIYLKEDTIFFGEGEGSLFKHTSGTLSGFAAINCVGTDPSHIGNITVKDIKIQGTGSRVGVFDSSDKGVFVQYADNITVLNITVTEVNGEAIYAQDSDDDIVYENNQVYNTAHNAYCFNGNITRGRVCNNVATNIGNMGFEGSGRQVVISDNIFEDYDSHGIMTGAWASVAYADNVVVSNNIIRNGTNSATAAINLQFGARASNIHGNICHNNVGYGILISGSTVYSNESINNTVANNVCYDNGIYGIVLDSATYTHVINNTCYNTAAGGTQNYGIYIDGSAADSTNVVEGNYCYENLTADLYRTSPVRATFGENYISDSSSSDIVKTRSDLRILTFTSGSTSILQTDNNAVVTNTGATGITTVQIPGAVIGQRLGPFIRSDTSYALRVDPGSASDYFRGQGGGKYLSINTIGGSVEIVCTETNVWDVIPAGGTTIAYEP